MNYVIIENDSLSLRRIKAMCERLRPEWHLAFTASTVEEACRLFELNPDIGLALCDIELDDGLSLSIFRKIPAEFPVIFITAFDEYTLDAFKLNSIDYLLKPLEAGALERAFIKFEKIERRVQRLAAQTLTRLEASLQRKNYISRLLISINDRFESVDIGTVAFFLSEDKYVYAVCTNGKEHITSFRSLNEIDDQLDPQRFFRVSRDVITSIEAVTKVSRWFKGKLKVKIECMGNEREVCVSAARRADFLSWLGR